MSEDTEPGSGKKHRIIHWNPDAGNEKVKRRWTFGRVLLWTVGGFFGLLFAAGGVIRLVKLVKPDAFGPAAPVVAVDPMVQFKTQNDAQSELAGGTKAIATLSKLPFQENPRQVEKFLLIRKDFDEGSRLYSAHEYARAYALLKNVNDRIAEFSMSIQTKGEAQSLYNKLLLAIKDMEGARSLAPNALDAATNAAATAYRLISDGDFLPAKRTIEQGLAELKKAENAVAEKVQENVWNGQQALTKGDKQGSIAAFKAALERAPDDAAAKQGLKRAETIDRVHALLLRAEEYEKNKEYDQAAEAFKNAFALDAFSATAQQGEARAKQLSVETKFNTAFQAAQAAFNAKDWDKAIAQAKAALAVDSKKTEVSSMLKTAQQNQHDDAVQRALRRGRDAQDRHDWVVAKDAFSQVAEVLDPGNTEARDGVISASQIIRALKSYETHVEQAEMLAARDDYQGAIKELNAATETKPSYLPYSERVQQLHALLQTQKDPVEVTFKSDGKTWVSIESFVNLNLFDTKTQKIYPGNYVIIGRRAGYKEVYIPVQIRGGTVPAPISVICTVRDTKS